MKKTKSLLAIILAVVMLVVSSPISALAATNAPAKPALPTFTSTTNTITLKWKKVSGANGYEVYKYNTSTKKYSKITSTTKLTYKASNLKAGTNYVYALKAYKTVKKKKYYSSYSSKLTATTLPSKPTGFKATPTYNSVSLSWSKVTGATGYNVYSYNSSTKKYTKLASTTKLSYKVSSLKENTSYKYAVMAYKTLNKKNYNSAYSSVITAKTVLRSMSAPEILSLENVKAFSADIKFSPVNLAEKYVVEYAENEGFDNSVSIIADNTECSLKLNQEKVYFVRVYAVRTVNGVTYSSPVSDIRSLKTLFGYTETVSTVNESKTYQTMEGFGASGCWWAQRLGQGTDAQIDSVMSLLYDKNDGIGLNIFRYNLGAGSKNDPVLYALYRDTETFLTDYNSETGELKYNWNNDAEAQKVLASAKKFAGDDFKLTLFCNSPPIQLTNNGYACSDNIEVDYWAGNAGTNVNYNKDDYLKNTRYALYHQNIGNTGDAKQDAKIYKAFAKYLTDIADHFEENGYDVYDISPVNEPQTPWSWSEWGGAIHMSQEGCHYTPQGMSRLAAYCALAGEDKAYKFSMFDSGAADGASEGDLNASSIKYIYTLYNNNNTIKDENGEYIKVNGKNTSFGAINKNNYTNLSIHSYWSDAKTKQEFGDYVRKTFPTVKTFTTTEFCQMTGDATNGITEWYADEKHEYGGYWDIQKELIDLEKGDRSMTSIKPGVQLAVTMYNDFTTLNSTEWDWWTACYFGGYPDALVYINDGTFDNVRASKRLWAMGNYSKFIDEGATRVEITEAQSDILSTAWKNPDGSLVVVYINQTENDMTTNLKAGNYKTSSTYVTSAEDDLKNVANTEYSIDNAVSIPSQSVVTVVLK